MTALCDSSVLIAALLPGEGHHSASLALLKGNASIVVHIHALNEVFATLTGGSLGFRVAANTAAQLIREQITARSRVIDLSAEQVTDALDNASAHGVRGGAVYDYMHLVAARKGQVDVIYTLNLSDFQQLKRDGDPEIRRP